MSLQCGFGQVGDIVGKSLCLKGKTIIDSKYNIKGIKNIKSQTITTGIVDVSRDMSVSGNINVSGNIVSDEITTMKNQISMLQAQVAMLITNVANITVGSVVLIANTRSANGGNTNISFSNTLKDSASAYDGTTFTAPEDGLYFISYYAFQGSQYVAVRVNGSTILSQYDFNTQEISGILDLQQGDLVTLFTFQSTSGSIPDQAGLSIHSINF